MLDASSTSPSACCSQTLPSLNKATVSVPQLSLKVNRPVRLPQGVDAWNRLQRIESIDVVPTESSASNSEALYNVIVYFRHNQNRIPTNNLRTTETSALLGSPTTLSAGSPRAGAAPDFQVVRTFSELNELRDRVWTAIRQYHPAYCELCGDLSVQMLTKLAQPALLTATIHRSRAKRARKIHAFVVHILSELHAKKPQCVPSCKGQSDLAILLHGFLFGPEDAPTSMP